MFLLFAALLPLRGAPSPVEGVAMSGNQLTSVTIAGKVYPQAQLSGGTLTAFASSSVGCVLVPNGSAIPASGTRAGLVGDWLLDSGIINPAISATASTVTFAQPIVNRAGPDIIFMEIDPDFPADNLQVTINGSTQTVPGSAWGATGFTTVSADQYSTGSNVASLAALEAATLTVANANISQNVYGVGIDLSDFGVPANGTITQLNFGADNSNAVDPVFIGGITGPGNQPPGIVSLPYVEPFTSSQGAFTSAAEWTAASGVYRNTITGTSATSIASVQTNDLLGDPPPGFFLSSKFTVTSNTSGGNAVGFALFGANSSFSGGVNLPYYLFDFRPSANALRFLRVGINNTAFLPDPTTLQTMTVNQAQPFYLEVSGTYETGVLRMALTVRQGVQSETFFVIDSEPLTGTCFGYRNRTSGGTLTVDCDDFTFRHLSTDTFTTTPQPFARPGELYSSSVAAVSDVSAAVSLSAVSLPSWMSFSPGANGSGTLTGTPTAAQLGSRAITLRASDNEGGTLEQTFHVPVLEPTGVFISEFLAENDSGLRDEDGDQSDWIELFNSDSTPANVGGSWLSDDPALPKKWAIPAGVTIPARSFLVIFASGKNRVDPAHLHTTFSLQNNAGASLTLANPAGTVISAFANYPAQRADHSYGAYGSYTSRGYLLTPTPGAPNDPIGYSAFVADTVFSVKRGFYTSAQSVAITCATPGTTLVYTTNGSTPSLTNGTTATSPLNLNISSTTVLRVAAFAPGLAPSGPDTQSYFFLEDIRAQQANGAPPPGWPAGPINAQVLQYGMDPEVTNTVTPQQMKDALSALPTLSIVTDLPNLFDPERGIYTNPYGREEGSECPISLELLHSDNSPGFHVGAGLRIRGGASRVATNPKHNFHVYFRGEYGNAKLQYPLFGDEGADEFDRIDLRTAQVSSWHQDNDINATYTRDEWNRLTHGAMGQEYTRSRYYHLYINGTYWGIYGTQERADSDFAASYFGGKKADYDVMKTYVIPHRVEAADGDNVAWSQLFNAATAGFASDAAYYAVQGLDAAGQPSATKPLVDVDSLIDYTLLRYYSGDDDGPVNTGVNVPKNFYAIRPRDGRFGYRFFTHDAESTLRSASTDVTGNTSVGNTLLYFNPRWLSQQMAANVKYRLRFADRVQKHFFNGGAIDTPVAIARWRDLRDQLSTAILAESARWGDAKSGSPRTVANWNSAIAGVETGFFATRRATLISQLRSRSLFPSFDAPAFSQHGGLAPSGSSLSITAPAGTTIYYTLNGTDPLSAGAATYSGPIPLNGVQVTVKARAKLGAEWSALTEALFTLGAIPAGTGHLAISEIHYNPLGATDDTEFIELVNRSGSRLDLSGVRLTGAVIFTFGNITLEPGARICVVEDGAAFAAEYGGAPVVAGQWSGALNNSSDTIILLDKDGNEIERVSYSDSAPWPTDPDGEGYSLVRVNPATNASNPLNWRNSTAAGGNPGSSDSTTFSDSPLADADGDSSPAVLEYFLGTSDTATNTLPTIGSRLPDGRMTLTFPRRLGADDVTYRVEASTNLTTWNVPVTRLQHTQQPNGAALETWAANLPTGPVYMRLRVSQP